MSSHHRSGATLKRWLSALSMLALLPLAGHAQGNTAEAWPAESLRMIVPFPAHGPTDIVARIVAQQAGAELGREIVVENRPGAGGTVGVGEVAAAAPDGYTLLLTTASTHAVSPHLYKAFPYDVRADFSPIAHIGSAGSILLVAPQLPVNSVQELIDHAKARPGKLHYGTSGSGTIVHLLTEAFMAEAGIDLTHMPYRGTGQARSDLLAGSVQVLMDAVPTGMPYVQRGQVRALAVTTRERLPSLPDVPTLRQAGLPGLEFTTWFGVYTPAGVPEARRARLLEAFVNAVQDPGVASRLQALGVTPAQPHTSDEFAGMVEADSERWKKIIEDNKISIQ